METIVFFIIYNIDHHLYVLLHVRKY